MDGSRLGRIVVAVRREKRLRQLDLARLANVDRSVVSRLEQGRVETLSIRSLGRITGVRGRHVRQALP
ncbi:MAG TPA: helix-turn-helix transcriptional regulator [Candidatus Limnocylindrales bacterium]